MLHSAVSLKMNIFFLLVAPLIIMSNAEAIPISSNQNEGIKLYSGFGKLLHEKNFINGAKNYKEFYNHQNSTICWIETIILKEYCNSTEDNSNSTYTISQINSVVIETPETIMTDKECNCLLKKKKENFKLYNKKTKCYEDFTFALIRQTKEFNIWEHKTVNCISGPTLSKEYIEIPFNHQRSLKIGVYPESSTYELNNEEEKLTKKTLTLNWDLILEKINITKEEKKVLFTHQNNINLSINGSADNINVAKMNILQKLLNSQLKSTKKETKHEDLNGNHVGILNQKETSFTKLPEVPLGIASISYIPQEKSIESTTPKVPEYPESFTREDYLKKLFSMNSKTYPLPDAQTLYFLSKLRAKLNDRANETSTTVSNIYN